MEDPGPLVTWYTDKTTQSRFFGDYCNWDRIPQYRDFVHNSPAAAIAAQATGSDRMQIFHEHVLVKEAGAGEPTPWHHDLPYYCVQGTQLASIWLALDPVPKSACPEFLAGSHTWGKLYYPRLFKDGADYAYAGQGYDTVPDVDSMRDSHRILSWDLEAGDALLFSFTVLHAAAGNPGRTRRAGFATRWLGDDATFADRPGTTSPPYPGIGLRDGDEMRTDWFPVIWSKAREAA
jgi:ectoine hydroxylase-related dioxygenase (phytanoyl-CoA dioxygenase family)